MRRKLLSIALALSMVVQLVPTPALAKMTDELEGDTQDVLEQVVLEEDDAAPDEEESSGEPSQEDGDSPQQDNDLQAQSDDAADAVVSEDETTTDDASEDASAVEADEADAVVSEDDVELTAQATDEDPFFFMDVETGQLVTTLHTTGTYQLVKADGSPYAEWTSVYFEYMGADPRGNSYEYHVYPKEVDTDGDDEGDAFYLEDFTCSDGRNEWQLPSGSYSIYNKSGWNHGYFAQRYRVVNDGLYDPKFDLSDDPSVYYEGSTDFHVKPYTEGKSDDDYDQKGDVQDDSGDIIFDWKTPDQNPFVLASDTRISFWIDTAISLTEDNKPQLESIALWKADESIETLVGTYNKDTDESTPGAYAQLWREAISRIPEILAEAGFDALPTWPTYLNFNDDSKLTTLWQRGDESLNERIDLNPVDVETGACTTSYVIIDHANFAGVVATDGVYFPIVTMSLGGETYTYAYHPIQVDATSTSVRNDPRITTTSLKDARVGDEYSATLKGKSGATEAGEFSWAVTDGTLPAGLTLDAATGVITGTPTTQGEQTFTVTLTETIEGEARTATHDFLIRVKPAAVPETAFEQLSLGPISYTPSTIWLPNMYGKSVYTNLRIPISLDIRDERYNLGETELVYMLKMTETHSDEPEYYVWRERAADLMSEDGTTLEVAAPLVKGLLSSPNALLRIRAFLVPQTNDGELAFPHELADNGTYSDGTPYSILPVFVTLAEKYGAEPGDAVDNGDGTGTTESQSYCFMNSDGSSASYHWYGTYAHYINMPEMPYTALENPKITFGSWARLSALRFEGSYGDWPVHSGRIRLWAYDGTTTPTAQQVKWLNPNTYDPEDARYHQNDPVFKLAPGTYAFVVEGEVPVYDENGVDTGEVAYVDISDKVSGATALKGTTPQQYIFSIGPSEGTEDDPVHFDVSYSGARVEEGEAHSLEATFEMEDGSYADAYDALPNGSVDYQVAWYRRAGDDESSDVLVATGNYVMFGPSEHDLYVEVTPTGRGASFWKTSGKVKVSDKNKTISVKVPRKQLFRGTFVLSCASGKTPAEGDAWGIIEVRTPLASGGYTSYNTWAYSNIVTLPDLTSGSVVTFTPSVKLDAGSVEYVVPEDASASFAAQLVAPQPQGLISFEGLHFTYADGTTADISLDDGATEVQVARVIRYGNGERSTVSVPHYQSDGSHIVLQPERYYGNHFLEVDGETTYEVTVTHRDNQAPARLGTEVADYAARQTFEVTLSRDKTSDTIEAAKLTSRGYATLELNNPGVKDCTLLLYNSEGTLVDKDATAISTTELRTPFLDAGSYTLYAVDSDCLSHGSYGRLEDLRGDVLIGSREDRGASITFDINTGTITRPDPLTYPDWEATELVNRANSTVSVASSYTDMVSITMHAELMDGAELPDDAYLELSTNQPSGDARQGYMSPKALSLNGRAVPLNRWDNLFGQTQCMADGSLKILLSEVRKLHGDSCASFPLDMTLVIPRTDMSRTEASVWVVTNNGRTRSLVGTARQEMHEISLSAPSTVAWQSFYVSGETGPNADVVLYVNGMRAGTTSADNYGYYKAEITLPNNLLDFTDFQLQATAQWTTKSGDVDSATSEVATVTYTTSFPVVERITMCYQSSSGEDQYSNIVTYYRGAMPNKYDSIYRSEHDNEREGEDHAKTFWLIEFANGNGVTDVKASVPRSASTVDLQMTDALKTAESWIDDVKTEIKYNNPLVMGGEVAAKSYTGQLVRDAFASDEVHAFVTKPEYFTYSPGRLDLSFDFDGDINLVLPMRGIADPGRFDGFLTCGDSELSAFLGAMGTRGNVLVCTAEDIQTIKANNGVVTWDNLPSVSVSQLKTGAGNIDEWFLLGSETIPSDETDAAAIVANNSLLMLHHQVTTQDMSAAQVKSEVQGVIDEAQRVIGPYESWLLDDGPVPTGEATRYNGRHLAQAAGTRVTQDDSYLYYIGTVDDNHNMQIETLKTYYLEGSDNFLYLRTRMDGSTMTLTTWDEKNGQRVDITYTIDEDQVDAQTGFIEVWDQWNYVVVTLVDAIYEAGGAVNELESQGLLTGQAETTTSDGDTVLTAQNVFTDIASKVGGFFGGTAKETTQNWGAKKAIGLKNKWGENTVGTVRDNYDYTDFNKLNQMIDEQARDPNAKPVGLKQLSEGTDLAENAIENIAVDTATASAGILSGGTAGEVAVNLAVNVTTSQATKGYQKAITDTLDSTAGGERKTYKKGDNWLYWLYWKMKWREKQGKVTVLWFFRHLIPEKMRNDYYRSWEKDYKAWCKQQAKQNEQASDPSGIVYEAVLSNPVEGATVKLYTYNPAAATYGLDEAQFVDSKQFGIEDNPQVTGTDGRYQWFVPEGYWQVKVSKAGYESFSTGDWGHEEERPTYDDDFNLVTDGSGNPVMEKVWVGDYGIDGTKTLSYKNASGDMVTVPSDSYWMPVLPIQLDVNIPLVSLDPPEVEKVEADEDGVTVTFTKYVKPDTVTTDLFAVDGAEPSAIEAVDAEVAGDGSGEMLARTYRLSYPADTKLNAGDNDLSVTYDDPEGKVTSYAGVAATGDGQHASHDVVVHVDVVDISSATVTAIANQTYTGKALTPAPVVTVDDATLEKDTDYTLSYANNTKPGTATVTITGKGNYTGSVKKTFKIVGAISDATVAISAQTYTGAALTPAPTVTFAGTTLKSGTDYTVKYANNTKPGTATVTITGKGNYTGSVSKTFPIAKASVSKATVSGIAGRTYNGKAQTQAPTVKMGTATLKSGTDYTLSYKNNVNAGTATVTITGKGNYTGTEAVTFKINPIDISKATMAAIATQGYLGSGKQVKPTPKLTFGGAALKSGVDFTLTYKNNAPKFSNKSQTQTATVTVTGTGNFKGTRSAKFTIKYIKPTWSGASEMPANSTAAYATTNGGWIRIKSGSARKTSDAVLSVSGKTVTAKKAGSSTLVLIDPFGTEIATKKVRVFTADRKTFEFESSVDRNYVLDIQGGSKKDGAQMIVYKRNNGKNQRYTLYLQSDGTYAIKSVNSGRYLTVESKTNKYVQQWAWKKGKNTDQRWRLTIDASNRVTFVNVKTNKCFDVQGGKTKNSAKMIVWKSNNGLNQKWKLNQK